MKAVVARRLARPWLRGPAFKRRDSIVIEGQKATQYEPMIEGRRIGVDLARVRTADDAVAFATRYGLLTNSGVGPSDEKPPAEMSQEFVEFERSAS